MSSQERHSYGAHQRLRSPQSQSLKRQHGLVSSFVRTLSKTIQISCQLTRVLLSVNWRPCNTRTHQPRHQDK